MEQYEHAFNSIQQMAHVMERSPSAFRTFEGQAAGKTFNANGKTDIVLRAGERNVLIAECQF
jgi:hypothetical protein